MSCGIYEIVNIENNKKYVGQSKDIERRWKEHLYNLNKNKHHSIKLQRAWNKYGKDNFKFKILRECDIDDLHDYEIEYIEKYDSFLNGYNMTLINNDYKNISKLYKYYDKNYENIDFFIAYFNYFNKIKEDEINDLYYYNLKFNLKKSKTCTRLFKICEMIKSIYTNMKILDNKLYYISKVSYLDSKFYYDLSEIDKPRGYGHLKNIKPLLIDLIYQLYYNERHKYIICFIPNILNFVDKEYLLWDRENILKFLNKNKTGIKTLLERGE